MAINEKYLAEFNTKLNTQGLSKGIQDINNTTKAVTQSTAAFNKFGIDIPRLMARAAVTIPIWAGLRAAVLALPTALNVAGKEWLSFQTEMSRVATATRGSIATFKILEDGIVSFTKTTGASFKDAASVVYALGSAGLTASQQLAGLPAIMNLAIGTFGDIEQSAKLVSGVFNVFGKSLSNVSTDFEKFQKIANVLSYTYALQQVELDELSTALGYVSSVGNIVNVSFEDLTATIGFLNSGLLKGSKAGTALLNTLLEIAQKPEKLRDLGLNIDTSKPISFFTRGGDETGIMNQLNKLFGESVLSMGNLNKLMEIFGNRGGKAVAVILTSWKRFQKALDDTNDPKKMADFAEALRIVAEDNIPTQFKKMSNKVTAIFFNMFDSFETPIRRFLDQINEALSRFDSLERARKSLGQETRTQQTLGGIGSVLGGAALLLAAPKLLGGAGRGISGLSAANDLRRGAIERLANRRTTQDLVAIQQIRSITSGRNALTFAQARELAPREFAIFQQRVGGVGGKTPTAAQLKAMYRRQISFGAIGRDVPSSLLGMSNAEFGQMGLAGKIGALGGRALGAVGILNMINGLVQAIDPNSPLAKALGTLTDGINNILLGALNKVVLGIQAVWDAAVKFTSGTKDQAPTLTSDVELAIIDRIKKLMAKGKDNLTEDDIQKLERYREALSKIGKVIEPEEVKGANLLAANAPLTTGLNAELSTYLQTESVVKIQQKLEKERLKKAKIEDFTSPVYDAMKEIRQTLQTVPIDILDSPEFKASGDKAAKDGVEKIKEALIKYANRIEQIDPETFKTQRLALLKSPEVAQIVAEGKFTELQADEIERRKKEQGVSPTVNLDTQRQLFEMNAKNVIALKTQTGEYTTPQAAQAEINMLLGQYNLGKKEALSLSKLTSMTDEELLTFLNTRKGDEKEILAIREKILSVTIKEREEIEKTGSAIREAFTGAFTDLFAGNIGFQDLGKKLAEGFRSAFAEQFGDIVGGGLNKILGASAGFGGLFSSVKNVLSGPIGKIRNAHIEGATRAAAIIENSIISGFTKAASGATAGSAVAGLPGGAIGGLFNGISSFMNTSLGTIKPVSGAVQSSIMPDSIGAPLNASGQIIGAGAFTGGNIVSAVTQGVMGYMAGASTGNQLGGILSGAGGALSSIGMSLIASGVGLPIGAALAGIGFLASGAGLLMPGQQDAIRPDNTSETRDVTVASKLDTTNRQLEIVNRNLIDLKQVFTTYILPDSAYFSEKINLSEQFSINARRGLA